MAAVGTILASGAGALWRDKVAAHDAFERVQSQRLRALVEGARERVPLLRERLGSARIERASDLAAVPPITKAEMMDAWDRSVATSAPRFDAVRAFAETRAHAGELLDGRYVVSMTSGTTGQVGTFVHDLVDWQATRGALLVRLLRHRINPYQIARFAWGRRYRMAWLVAMDGPYITYLLTQHQPAATPLFADIRTFSILAPMTETVAALNAFQPHFIHGYPTFVEALGHERLSGRLRVDPEFVSLGSEAFSQPARATLAQAFPGAFLAESYGMTECLPVANTCRAGRLHVNEDCVVLEAVDAERRPVPPGVPSTSILVTNLFNHLQPIVRYEVSDSVTFVPGPCECGSALQVIEVNGRTDDVFYLRTASGEIQPHAPIAFEVLFLRTAGLRQFQLVHEAQNRLRVRYVVREGARPDDVERTLRAEFGAYFTRHGLGDAVSLALEATPQLERPEVSQKVRQIQSLVARPESTR